MTWQAVEAAKDCVVATQAPDVNARPLARRRSSTAAPEISVQAVLYSSLFVQAYQVANVHTQVSDRVGRKTRNARRFGRCASGIPRQSVQH